MKSLHDRTSYTNIYRPDRTKSYTGSTTSSENNNSQAVQGGTGDKELIVKINDMLRVKKNRHVYPGGGSRELSSSLTPILEEDGGSEDGGSKYWSHS